MILFASLIVASRYVMAKSGSLSQNAISRIEGRKVGGGGWGMGGGNYKSSTDPASRLFGLNSSRA